MQKNTIIIAVIIIAVIIIGAFAATTLMKPNTTNTASAVTANATKLTFHNNGTTWLYLDVTFENATAKNGTTQTFYGRMYLKPNGTAVIDLSNILGYGNEKVPDGTVRVMAWKSLFNPTAGGTGALSLDMQGWSGTTNVLDSDAKYNMFYQPMPILALPSINGTQISKDVWAVNADLNELNKQIPPANNTIFEEELFTANNGKMTMSVVQAPGGSIFTVTINGITTPLTVPGQVTTTPGQSTTTPGQSTRGGGANPPVVCTRFT